MLQETQPIVITISRQLGSGGGLIGERLAAKLKAAYLDREILRRAAEELKVSEEELESLDEKTTPLWQSILLSSNYASPMLFATPPTTILPSDLDLFKVETKIITHIAEKNNTVVLGRCGWFIMRNHPRHVSVYLYANVSTRSQRLQEKFKLTAEKALKNIEYSDKSRSHYVHSVTGSDWNDARQYHLCIDTGALDLTKVDTIIIDYLQSRFGPLDLADIPVTAEMGKYR
jgi:cytidylate kinase